MDGYTTSNDGVSELIRSLEANIYFSKVEPKFTEQETWASGSVKKFELEFRIGKQDARIE